MKRPTEQAHEVVAGVVRLGDVVIDATTGNGHDTLFLARLVGDGGRVVGFDVQQAAIDSTRRRLEKADVAGRVELHCESHTQMASRTEAGGVGAIMFNLGYLPGADHELITLTRGTLMALDAAERLVRPGGVITIVCYPGHAGGDEEACAVKEWGQRKGAEVFPQAREGAPFLVVFRMAE